ncbi:uncharacterized protein VICG_00201 [Vittaforma corneae ATCC 50505]|uniref:Uncharacterized protein n=1 Tax=Vittaforma corneae (strain ATCC 50505) TaxID=993615 RepID=L2GPX0_VITCO|nr:uncharacterized protein VICG_00201 [Vittaforma corneae ATCC 50505]ELA42886.1 hypothetical protein VICG_00201 [Vittaforma corneae ATCC 50505]
MNCKHCSKQIIDFGIYETLFNRKSPETCSGPCSSVLDGKYMPRMHTDPDLIKSPQTSTEAPENKSNKRQLWMENEPFMVKLSVFESLGNTNGHDVADTCRPSKLNDFQKEKLERICKSKVNSQLKHQTETFMNYDFRKNSKTGEYEIDECSSKQIKSKADSLLKNGETSTVKLIIQQLEENCNKKDDKKNECKIIGNKSVKFSEILKKFSQPNSS